MPHWQIQCFLAPYGMFFIIFSGRVFCFLNEVVFLFLLGANVYADSVQNRIDAMGEAQWIASFAIQSQNYQRIAGYQSVGDMQERGRVYKARFR